MNHAFSIIPLTIETRGEIITNNLSEFRELVREALSNINRDLKTDEEFGQAELDVKALKAAEDSVREAAIKSFDDQLKALVDGLNETAEEIRVPRLELEKLIAQRKEQVKTEIIDEFLSAFDIEPSRARKQFLAGLQTAIKGKRTLESMRTACRIYQTTQQAVITTNRKSIATFEAAHGQDLTMDRTELELQSSEYLTGELRRRWEAKKAAEERKRLEAEAAAAKAAEAKAKAEAEAARKEAEAATAPTPARQTEPAPANVERGPWAESKAPEAVATVQQGQTADEEWKAFKATCVGAFGPIKAARDELKHSKNIAKAQGFGNAMNAAWRDWT